MTTENQAQLKQQSDQLYAQYVKPLEREHSGKFIAVAKDGRTVLASDLLTLADEAVEQLGRYVFTSATVPPRSKHSWTPDSMSTSWSLPTS
jgi:hypothetical protein